MSQAEATARQQQIERLINMLASSNWRDRRDAALMLGELAADSAVDELVSVYLNDSNAKVRDAADYALGQFRAVDIALQAGKEDKVTKLLTKVEIEGKIGQRRRTGRWIKTVLALALSLAALFAINRYLPSGVLSSVVVVPTIAPPPVDYAAKAAVAAQIRPVFNQLRDNLNTLQSQFQSALGGGSFDCQAYFNNIPPNAFSQFNVGAFADLAQVVNLMNDILSREQAARERFDAACFGGETLDAQAVAPVYGMIVPALQALPTADAVLTAAENAQPAPQSAETLPPAEAGATTAPTSPVEATLVPTIAPTLAPPTREIVIVDPDSALRDLMVISDGLVAPRGAGSLILQYWTDAANAGQTQGCNDLTTATQIPANYQLPADVAQAVPPLAEASGLVNSALSTIRTSWTVFGSACQAGTLRELADSQIAMINGAMSTLTAAQTLMTVVQNS